MKPSSKARRKKLVFLFLSHTILSQIYFLLVRNKLDNEGQEMRICVCLLPPPTIIFLLSPQRNAYF